MRHRRTPLPLTRKSGEVTAAAAGGRPGSGGWMLRRRLQGDFLAGDLFELADQRSLAAALVDVGLVEVGAEVAVVRVRVGEQVPDDGQHRVADGDERLLFAAPV